jgi:hypothetical protein
MTNTDPAVRDDDQPDDESDDDQSDDDQSDDDQSDPGGDSDVQPDPARH